MESIDTRQLTYGPWTHSLPSHNRSSGEYESHSRHQESPFTIDDVQSIWVDSEIPSSQTIDLPERLLQDEGPPFSYAAIKRALGESTELDVRLDDWDDVRNIKFMLRKLAQRTYCVFRPSWYLLISSTD